MEQSRRNSNICVLHLQEISRDFMLVSENGCLIPAMKVFSESIKYLKTHLENHINSKTVCIKPQEIEWVLTIPAIWTDPAKQFMREAANIVSYVACSIVFYLNLMTIIGGEGEGDNLI